MKKLYSLLIASLIMVPGLKAQSEAGGFPTSMIQPSLQATEYPTLHFERPDYEAILAENQLKELQGIAGPYMVATSVMSSIDLTNSGSWAYAENGDRVWRLAVVIPDALAIGILFNQYELPEGVRLFLQNAEGSQLQGAYTAKNNTSSSQFATPPIGGSEVLLEMNVPPGVSPEEIKFHIDEFTAYYRGVDDLLRRVASKSGQDFARPTQGESAPCHLDANCPLPTAQDYSIPKKATCRITIQGGGGGAGFCSGTLINNTGNGAEGTCLPYILTASHCDGANSFENSHFSRWLFRFNYRTASCEGTTLEGNDPSYINNTLVGASFKARSYFPSFPGGQNPKAVGDFLLLQAEGLPSDIAAGTYLAGWNRDPGIYFDNEIYDFFIGFHHPRGDVERVAYSFMVDPQGRFNQQTVSATHWYAPFNGGGTQPGSSGSGLFDVFGHLIGDLSGGTNTGCQNNSRYSDFGREGLYSKISYAWENAFDQNNHPNADVRKTRLKDWLDPLNSGQMALSAMMPTCQTTARIDRNGEDLERSILFYPNPSSSGKITVKFNLPKQQNLMLDVYTVSGQKVRQFSLNQIQNGEAVIDCSGLAEGVYQFTLRSDDGLKVNKKIVLLP